MAQKIIDVSRYQGDIDWGKVKAAGVTGAILKTVSTNYSQFGGLYIDPYFEKNYKERKAAGLNVGAYYYTYAQDKRCADKELRLFKKAIEGKQFELPLVVDVEDNYLKPLSADALTDLVIYALGVIESWGCYAMFYTYESYKNTELNMAKLKRYDWWLRWYTSNKPAGTYGIWQYTSTAKVDGIKGNVDMSWRYKDYAAIIKKAGLNGFKKEEPEPVKEPVIEPEPANDPTPAPGNETDPPIDELIERNGITKKIIVAVLKYLLKLLGGKADDD